LKDAEPAVYFLTENAGKYREASRLAARFGVKLGRLSFSKQEIQSNDLTEIAMHAARQAASEHGCNVVSEDAGFFVDALKGFPGPYSSYVYRTLGVGGILKLMEGVKNRRAFFKAAVAYCEPRQHAHCFTGGVGGTVSKKARGSGGFGFDPIFIPAGGEGRTFAEMSVDEKNALSHRSKAFGKFFLWLTSVRSRVTLRQVK